MAAFFLPQYQTRAPLSRLHDSRAAQGQCPCGPRVPGTKFSPPVSTP